MWTKAELTARLGWSAPGQHCQNWLFQSHLHKKKLSPSFSAVVTAVVALEKRRGWLLSIEIPSNITFAQRRRWADDTSWVDDMYFMVIVTIAKYRMAETTKRLPTIVSQNALSHITYMA